MIGPEKMTPLSNLTKMVSLGMKTYSKSRKELRNLQILKNMLEKSSQFLSSEQPCKPKSLDVSLDTLGHLIRVLIERSVSDVGNLCPLWLVILKSV